MFGKTNAMTTRKQFIIQSTITTGIGMLGLNALAEEKEKSASKNLPIMVATWDRTHATEAGWKKMTSGGGTSLDAVEAGGMVQESDVDDMSVGKGGLPDRDGYVTLDASIMDYKGNAGSVTFLQNIVHAVSVARRVMEKTPHVILSGDGAYQFAIAEGFKKENLLTDAAKQKWMEWKKESKYEPIINIEKQHDTIGLLAIDGSNHIAGACTTSGLGYKMHGRVGDSPIVGAGMFVDDEVGGAVATGVGELSLKTLGTFLITELMRNGKTPQQACEEAIHRVCQKYEYKKLQLGFLAINKNGEVGAYSIQKGFQYAVTIASGSKVYDADSFLK